MSKKIIYKVSSAWRITQEDDSLIISGGADALYTIDLPSHDESFFVTIGTKPFKRQTLSKGDQIIIEQLVSAGVVQPVISGPQSRLRVKLIGESDAFSLKSTDNYKVVGDSSVGDVVVVVRRSNTYAQLLESIDYTSLTTPHLLIDMAFNHTLVIGPLVFPGETACLACLEGRLTKRWGDHQPPQEPAANQYESLALALVDLEINKIHSGDTALVNNTATWNFQDREIKQNKLFTVPFCPICSQKKLDLNGMMPLRWVKDETPSN